MTGFALAQGWVRLARATVLGGASLFLAAAAHVMAGGSLPGAGLLTLTGVGVGLAAVSLTTRRVRFGLLLGVLSAEQALLHLIFHTATATATTCAPVSMVGHHLPPTVCGTATPATTGWSMLVGHALAVLVTAWLLARGEQWLWSVADRVHRYATARPSRYRRSRPAAVLASISPLITFPWALAGSRGPPVP